MFSLFRCPQHTAPRRALQVVALASGSSFPWVWRQVSLLLTAPFLSSSLLPHNNTWLWISCPHLFAHYTCSSMFSPNPQVTHLIPWRFFLCILAILSSTIPIIILGDFNVCEINSSIPLTLLLFLTPWCYSRTCHYEKHSLKVNCPLRPPSLFFTIHFFLIHQLQPF